LANGINKEIFNNANFAEWENGLANYWTGAKKKRPQLIEASNTMLYCSQTNPKPYSNISIIQWIPKKSSSAD